MWLRNAVGACKSSKGRRKERVYSTFHSLRNFKSLLRCQMRLPLARAQTFLWRLSKKKTPGLKVHSSAYNFWIFSLAFLQGFFFQDMCRPRGRYHKSFLLWWQACHWAGKGWIRALDILRRECGRKPNTIETGYSRYRLVRGIWDWKKSALKAIRAVNIAL